MVSKDEDSGAVLQAGTSEDEPGKLEIIEIGGRKKSPPTTSFVEREAQRQKRMLTFYLLLLSIPLILGVVLLKYGRSDSQMLLDEFKKQAPPLVKSEIQQQVGPAIHSEVQTQVNSSLGAIGEIRERQQSLEGEVKEIRSTSARLTPEEVQTIKRSSAVILEKEAEIRKLNQRIETLELQMKDRRPQIRPEDLGKDVIIPRKNNPQ